MTKKKKQVEKEFGLSSWAITNKTTMYVLIVVIFYLGISAFFKMPRESFPEVNITKVFVSSIFPGNTAEDIEKMAKEARWEGNIVRSSKDESSLTVRKVGGTDERIVKYDSSTRWVSQEHGSKKVNDIDAGEVKDGDRVICKGTWDKDGVLHATLISKRLTGM